MPDMAVLKQAADRARIGRAELRALVGATSSRTESARRCAGLFREPPDVLRNARVLTPGADGALIATVAWNRTVGELTDRQRNVIASRIEAEARR